MGARSPVQVVERDFIFPTTVMSSEGPNDKDFPDIDPIRLTFIPELYLQRRIWVLDVLRREDVVSVIIPHTCSIFIISNAIYAPGR